MPARHGILKWILNWFIVSSPKQNKGISIQVPVRFHLSRNSWIWRSVLFIVSFMRLYSSSKSRCICCDVTCSDPGFRHLYMSSSTTKTHVVQDKIATGVSENSTMLKIRIKKQKFTMIYLSVTRRDNNNEHVAQIQYWNRVKRKVWIWCVAGNSIILSTIWQHFVKTNRGQGNFATKISVFPDPSCK